MFKGVLVAVLMAAITMAGGCRTGDHHGGGSDRTVQTIGLDQVPPQVLSGFQQEFPNAQVQKVKKETYANGVVHYEFEFTGADGKKMEVEVDEDGEVLEAH